MGAGNAIAGQPVVASGGVDLARGWKVDPGAWTTSARYQTWCGRTGGNGAGLLLTAHAIPYALKESVVCELLVLGRELDFDTHATHWVAVILNSWGVSIRRNPY